MWRTLALELAAGEFADHLTVAAIGPSAPVPGTLVWTTLVDAGHNPDDLLAYGDVGLTKDGADESMRQRDEFNFSVGVQFGDVPLGQVRATLAKLTREEELEDAGPEVAWVVVGDVPQVSDVLHRGAEVFARFTGEAENEVSLDADAVGEEASGDAFGHFGVDPLVHRLEDAVAAGFDAEGGDQIINRNPG